MSFRSASNKNDWFPGLFPMVPGHEIVGKIVKVGDHVKDFKVGELAGVGMYGRLLSGV